ncbi:MAG: GTP-binding protein, partial [bacterium]
MDDPAKLRNFALIGHAGSGKTSLGDALLFFAGATKRLGKVADGTSVLDFYPEEIERKSTFTLSVATFTWNGYTFNLIDPPGFMDFAGDVASALRAADVAVLVINATGGVEVGAEKYWDLAQQAGLPRIIFINQMASEKAKEVTDEVRNSFGSTAVPLQVTQGIGPLFKGVFSILGANVPADLIDEADERKEQLIEALAEVSDALAEKYLDGKPISEDEIAATLKQGIAQGKIAPVLYGDALAAIGLGPLLDLIVKEFPSPLDIPLQPCVRPEGRSVKPDSKGPLAALVFKTVSEPHVGEISYVRVFSGELKA